MDLHCLYIGLLICISVNSVNYWIITGRIKCSCKAELLLVDASRKYDPTSVALMPLPADEFMIEQEPEDLVTQIYTRLGDILTPSSIQPAGTRSMFEMITPMFEDDYKAEPQVTQSCGLIVPQSSGGHRQSDDDDVRSHSPMESIVSFMKADPLGGHDDDDQDTGDKVNIC